MFGWIVTGTVNAANRRTCLCNLAVSNNDLHEQVERFWAVEEINIKRTLTRNELRCETHFLETFRRDNQGRFELGLPLKDNVATLGDSLGTAISRFELLEKRFERDPNFKEKYVEFIEEYERLNHMSQIDVSKDNTNTVKYYLPHHVISKIFDPLGLISPTTVPAKLFLQNLWQTQTSWDEVIPLELHSLWKQFYKSIENVNDMKIPRKVLTSGAVNFELHAFGDALLCAKSKIAPLKRITLPRLELNAALLLSRLVDKAVTSLEINFIQKVTEIQELSKTAEWRYVPSLQNPADIVSRGRNPLKLMESEMWWYGPEFLREDCSCWPEQQIFTNSETLEKRANNELKLIAKSVTKAVNSNEVRDYILVNSITWHFIPLFSPHHGGLWEAAIKSAKAILFRIIGSAHLTYESLYTVLTQVEAVLNSRPLLPLINDPEDYSFLTPSHFGDTLMNVPECDVSEIPTNRLKYEHLQKITHFLKRWAFEYFTSLQQRSKWTKSHPNLAIGDLVINKDDNLPKMCWNVGRITSLHPGDDGVRRVVSVLVHGKIVKRSVQKLCKLPINE
ncbi:hypothetical protein Trydic_g17036 [Trypoxylus dichotomus]